jgi:hypothetical protein
MIIDIIKTIESSNNQYAFRFEEKLYFHHKALKTKLSKVIKQIKVLNNCSTETALMIMSTSWGLFQLLGINIYSLGAYDKSIIDFLMNIEEQSKVFFRFCNVQKIDLIKTQEELVNITKFYNDIKEKVESKMVLITELEQELQKNKEKYHNLICFIERYNGAKFLSNNFIDYLIRMINETKKYLRN